MKKSHSLLLGMILIFATLFAGCSDQYSSSMATPTPPVDVMISKNFSTIVLPVNDLPYNCIVQGEPTISENEYTSTIVYIGGSTDIPLTFKIKRYPTVDQAKSEFIQKKNSITDVRVDNLNIGREGFGYQRVADTYVIFRNANLIVSFNVYAYPAISIDQLVPYAIKINQRIEA